MQMFFNSITAVPARISIRLSASCFISNNCRGGSPVTTSRSHFPAREVKWHYLCPSPPPHPTPPLGPTCPGDTLRRTPQTHTASDINQSCLADSVFRVKFRRFRLLAWQQAVEPARAARFPVGHAAHDTAPEPPEYLPRGHSSQSLDPAGAYFPGRQALQPVDPVGE